MNKLIFILLFISNYSFASLTTNSDSIRGALRPERICFDVNFYDLEIDIDPEKRRISGQNDIYFKCLKESKTIQIDLFKHYQVQSVSLYSSIDSSDLEELIPVNFKKVQDALFISFQTPIQLGKHYKLRIAYQGSPNEAKKAPWDGGFVWKKDSLDRHFCGVACEGWGASSWWPL